MTQYECLSKEQKEELVEKAYQLGYEYEQECGCCSQCTVAAIQDTFGILDNDLFKAVYGMGAGIGLTGKGSCGALAAGVLVIGALRGRERTDFHGGRNPQCYALARQLLERFESKYRSSLCSGIQECKFGRSFDLTDRLQRFAFEEAGGHRDKCPEVVGTAARWVAEMIVNGEI